MVRILELMKESVLFKESFYFEINNMVYNFVLFSIILFENSVYLSYIVIFLASEKVTPFTIMLET